MEEGVHGAENDARCVDTAPENDSMVCCAPRRASAADLGEAREEGVHGAAQEVVAVGGLPAPGALLRLQLPTADSRIQKDFSRPR